MNNIISAKKAKKKSNMVYMKLIKPTAQKIQENIISAIQRGDNSCVYWDEKIRDNIDFRQKIIKYFEKLGYVVGWEYVAKWLVIKW